MTLNLTELRDEPLGTPKSGIEAAICCMNCYTPPCMNYTDTEMALGDAADGEGVFKFDVDGLSDEALDPRPAVNAFGCATGCMYEPQTQP